MMSGKRGNSNTSGKLWCKKGQSANEAMMLITMLTFFLIATLAAVSDDLIRASDDNYKALLQDLADFLEQEAQIAFASENGYFHSFALPPTLDGQPYITSITNSTSISSQTNITILTVASKRPNVQLNATKALARDVRGSIVRGRNTLRKERGIVEFRPLPLSAAEQTSCDTAPPNPPSCGSDGAIAPQTCCDYGYTGCCT
ncbi:hypothetical protein HYU16_00190 [Candidatus Woesearchaeota archaeon]|nr:hypothetical protein [Candidatus Woesearchaeota archaeon]